MGSGVVVRKLRPTEVEPISAVMLRAFDSDPVANYIVKNDARRRARLRAFLKLFTEPSLPHGEVYVADGLEGAAFWIPPGKLDTGVRANLRLLPNLLRAVGFRRLLPVISRVDAVDKHHPHEPHFYLPLIGVDPAHQGRGLGSALLRPILDRCDRERILAYLESSNELNIRLYERHGFRVTAELRLGKDGPPIWPMRRDPS